MLVLPVNTKGPLIALADDAAPGRFAAASSRPRLARRADGTPLLQLDRWAPSSGSSSPAPALGGRLNLTVDAAPLPAEVAASGLAAASIEPISWLDASIELMGPLFQPVKAEVAVAAGALGVVAVELTPDAASVLASLLTRDVVSPLQVVWTGSALVRLPAVEIIASASIDQTKTQSALRGPSGYQVSRSLIEANAHIEIRGAANSELEAAFRDWALGELTRRLEEGGDLSVRGGAAQVVRWPIRLATTLDDLLSADQRQSLVRTYFLDPGELGKAPPVEVRALGDFGGRLERVDVRLTPSEGGAAKELAIASDQPQRVALGSAHFSWSYRAKLVSQPPGPWSAPQEVGGSYSLLIPVPAAGELRVEALASGIDFERRWSSIRIQLTHQAAPPDAVSTVVELDAAHPSALWTRSLSGPRGKVGAKLTFCSQQGQSVEKNLDDVPGEQLVVGEPLDSDRRRLALMPAGNGWEGVALVMVDLRYRDGEFLREETVELRSFTDFTEWETPARADGPRAIEWRCHASYLDGRFEQTGWQVVESAVLAVPLQAPASRQVQLVPVFFDSSQTSRLEVRFSSGDRTVTQVVAAKTALWVTLPKGPYRWSVTWRMTDGTQAQTPERESDDDVVVLPRRP